MDFYDNFAAAMVANKLENFATRELSEKFEALTARMLEVNSHFNLTAIKDIPGIIVKHYADSLTISPYIPEGAKLIDIGCGAGFPSLPLAIARPDLAITSLDSTAKRINYIRETAELFGLTNIRAVVSRAEDAAKLPEMREQYDISCARAVARLSVLSELCLPFVRVGGSFIAMKARLEDELPESKSGIKLLGGTLSRVDEFELLDPISGSDPAPRAFVLVSKVSRTPKGYPRAYAQIVRKVL